MSSPLILASGSEIRAQLLRNAGLDPQIFPARIDEDMMRESLLAESAPPRDVADTLAEMKALKVSDKHPGAMVLGCDQVLDHQGTLFSKAGTIEEARDQLQRLRGSRHMLLSAAVICQNGKPLWRHVGQVRLYMRDFSDSYLDAYLDRNWNSARHAVGCYKLEEEGVRLFHRIEGDYFTVLGLPLLDLLSHMALIGEIDG